MKNSFIISFKLKITYRVNTLIYAIKQIPLIKRIIPDGVYGADGLKILGILVAIIYEFFSTFVGKSIYMFLMIYVPSMFFKISGVDIYYQLLLFLTGVGALVNTYMFEPSNDKYYAMISMKMDAKNYTISNFIYNLLKVGIGFLPFVLIVGYLMNVNLAYTLIIPLFVISMKINLNAIKLYNYKHGGKIVNKDSFDKLKWILIIILCIFAYLLPLFNIIISGYISFVIFIISIITSIFAFKYLLNFDLYYKVYKNVLNENDMESIKANQTEINKESTLNLLDTKNKYSSNKEGYAYFNELFIKRHNSVLYKFAKIVTIVLAVIISFVIIIMLINYNIREYINSNVLYILPFLLFIMYAINTGQKVARIMFINCDSAMLSYSFYRKPKVILSLFKERLKSIVKMNLFPSLTLSIGLLIIMLIGGNKNIEEYLIIFFSINSMSIFFSVHNLVIYYLLQPYNANSDIKGGTYQIVNMITYIACYEMLQLKIPANVFGSSMVIFSVLYVFISLFLVYKLAYKTFKIRN